MRYLEAIKNADDLLQIISQVEKARMVYEARQAEIHDQLTRLHSAHQKGKAEGKAEDLDEAKVNFARPMLSKGEDIVKIAKYTGLSREEIENL